MTPKENAIIAYRHEKPLWIPSTLGDIAMVLQTAVRERFDGTEENLYGCDDFGVEYKWCTDIAAPIPLHHKKIITDMEKWREQLVFPDVDKADWKAAAERDLKNVDRENQFIMIGLIRGHFERLHSMMGFEEALMALLTDTDEVSEYFKAFTDYRLKMIDKIAEYYKPDSIMLNDDYASADGMLMDPNLWREILKPQIKRMIDRIHEHGIYCTMHCCGKMEPIFSDYVEIKADALHPIQAMNDVKGLKAKYGSQITFVGCMDNTRILEQPNVTDEIATKEIRRVFDEIAADGSYMLSQRLFHPVSAAALKRELEAYNREAKEKYMTLVSKID